MIRSVMMKGTDRSLVESHYDASLKGELVIRIGRNKGDEELGRVGLSLEG